MPLQLAYSVNCVSGDLVHVISNLVIRVSISIMDWIWIVKIHKKQKTLSREHNPPPSMVPLTLVFGWGGVMVEFIV